MAALSAFAYAVAGWTALMLAGPPAYAAPLYPAAGLALAAVLTWGRPAVLGVLAGAFAVNASLGWLRGQAGLALFVLPFIIAIGAAAQAWVGAQLIHRFVGKPLLLNEPRDIAVAGAVDAGIACVTSASVATLALWASGAVVGRALFDTWLTWLAGDTVGALIAALLALAFIGRPAAAWRPRRRSLGVPLLAALALLAGAMWAIAERERAYAHSAFEREADRLAVSVPSPPRRHRGRAPHRQGGGHGRLPPDPVHARRDRRLVPGRPRSARGTTASGRLGGLARRPSTSAPGCSRSSAPAGTCSNCASSRAPCRCICSRWTWPNSSQPAPTS